ncbi:tyrosine-type recombinase/integrase [Halopiger aswanensis]|uniref:Tyr recombinase domain-containing protein n=1 Tax=Halopiger aswanensis TaxID=148449 RepID=A0A3R7GF24_9EURY|nr:site-specific integrase [Halopiger aswanensis]RKD88005.1 hypothetical protein ATJ93_4491 [Halopiger aswanensis]
MSQQEQINWSRMSFEELQHFWNTEVEPDLARDGLDLETRPTYEEITEAGYSGIAYALREHHDLTLAQFLATVGYPDPGRDEDYSWGIEDETTIRELEWYLEKNLRREGLADTTIDSKRSRLARFVRTYADLHGRADIVTRIREDSADVQPRIERQRVRDVFDEWDETNPDPDLESHESRYKHLLEVQKFYERLVMDRDAEFNPAAGAPHETNWKGSTPGADDRDPPALKADDVRVLVDACDSVADRLLVVATCAWGLRRREVARLSRDQFAPTDDDGFDFEAEDPHIVFDEKRKNGPGRVSILYGLETLADRWTQLSNRDDWDGYLFPSSAAESGHRSPDTITKRFKRLAKDAGLEIREQTPTPQYGRRFWYRTYGDAVKRLSSQIEAVAAEQGSSDPNVVVENYLGEEEARKRRREFMREELAAAFESEVRE